MDDWGRLPAGLPAFTGNLDVGHCGTYAEPNDGEFGRVGVNWLKWQLKGDTADANGTTGADGTTGAGRTAEAVTVDRGNPL